MRLSIASKLIGLLGMFLLAILGTVGAFSYLLHLSTRATSDLMQTSRANTREASELMTLVAKAQGLTLRLLSSEDPDAIEGLIGQGGKVMQEARGRIEKAKDDNGRMASALSDLSKANARVKDAVLHGQGAQANQIFINASTPAFETLLKAIHGHQDHAMQRVDSQVEQSNASLHEIQLGFWALGVLALLAMGGVGLWLVISISRPLRGIGERVRDMAEAEGDLTERLPVLSNDELGDLSRGMNAFLDKLYAAVTQVAATTGRLAAASEQINAIAGAQANTADAQRDQIHQVATAMHEMGATTQDVSRSSTKAAEASAQAAATAAQGGEIVNETLVRMQSISAAVTTGAERVQSLGKSSHRVGEIVDVIGNIAGQTNLLALNAAIEAARAGEQGRGFAVVADEVRNLAARTTSATREIGEVIGTIQKEIGSAVEAMQAGTTLVAQGVESTAQAGGTLRQIIEASGQVDEMITQIASAVTEQSAATDEVNRNLERISQDTANTAGVAGQAARAAEELTTFAHDLQRVVRQFKLGTV
jgi:methyl-accepting chemotaxis protein